MQSRFQQQNNNFDNTHSYNQQIPYNEFDGKRLRKSVVRKTIDYNSSIINHLEARIWQRDYRDQRAIQPDRLHYQNLTIPMHLNHNPTSSVTTKCVRTSTNKVRCPIYCVAWTPEGRRLVTGSSNGEFTLWNGLTFNFETILQAHDSAVRSMVWSHCDTWMVTGDHSGFVKYWQLNMNNIKMFQAHKEPIRGTSFGPNDVKFATCSDDGTIRLWDFVTSREEKVLQGHGADVKCLDWHPHKGLIVSGSRDSQQPVKLWDPKTGRCLTTLHVHKSTVKAVRWNRNGNWLLTSSTDQLVRLFDVRNLKGDVQTFRGHKKEVSSLAWHPVHETLFCSGGFDGSLMFWEVGCEKEVGFVEQAHTGALWSLAWHPIGHLLCSGSNDHSSKFWTRSGFEDQVDLNASLATVGEGFDYTSQSEEIPSGSVIPGFGLEKNEGENDFLVPGLDLDDAVTAHKKLPYAKPIPQQFQSEWAGIKKPLLPTPPHVTDYNVPHNNFVHPGFDFGASQGLFRDNPTAPPVIQQFQQQWSVTPDAIPVRDDFVRGRTEQMPQRGYRRQRFDGGRMRGHSKRRQANWRQF